ncbi:MAG: uracil-DNA glycosylase [Phycisphaeraceae bacterium]
MDPRDHRRLRQQLITDQLLGVDAVPIRAHETITPPVTPSTEKTTTRTEQHSPPARAQSNVSNAVSPRLIDESVPMQTLTHPQKLDILQSLSAQVSTCTACGLAAGRTQTVFGEGNPDADIMFIGEGPGQNEDEQGRPFVGRAGQLLDKQIVAMGLERSEVYIANVVKCRPPGNRNPQADEVEACSGYLKKQIETIQPKAIVTLGGPAAKLILATAEGITRIRGTWHTYPAVNPPVPVMPTFHPAYLLRSYTVENRKKVWSDLCAVLEKLGRTPPTPPKPAS